MRHSLNRRCQRAHALGNLRQFIHLVARHADRLERWVRYGRAKKWPRWGTVICDYYITRRFILPYSEGKTGFKRSAAVMLILMDHYRRKAHVVHTDWAVSGDKLLTKYGLHCRYPTYEELMSEEYDENCLQLGHIAYCGDLDHGDLDDLDVDQLGGAYANHLKPLDLIELFEDRPRRLPAHFPKDFRLKWDCDVCGNAAYGYPENRDGHDWVCSDCDIDGTCDMCDEWCRPDDISYYSLLKGEKRVCLDCRYRATRSNLDDPLRNYLEAERSSLLIEPLEKDPAWKALMARFQDLMAFQHDVEAIKIDFDNPEELIDDAAKWSNSYSMYAMERIPWYSRQGWTVRRPP